MDQAFLGLNAMKELAVRDPEMFIGLMRDILTELVSEHARLIWWPNELPIPQFHGPIGKRKMVPR